MQREILEARPTADIRVYAVWVPFLNGTRAAAELSTRVLTDPRVIQYWDQDAVTSAWFAEHVEHSSAPAWDVYFLFGPDARWTSVPRPLVGSGGTIIGQSSALGAAVGRLLAAGSG